MLPASNTVQLLAALELESEPLYHVWRAKDEFSD